MELFSISALVSFVIFAVVLWVVFIVIKWAVAEFGLPAIVVKISGIILGLVFLLRLISVLGVK